MTRRAVVTQAQIERGLRAAKAAMPEQPWRIRITPAEVTIEPALYVGSVVTIPSKSLVVDEDEDIVL